jgi:hypothetical protein
MTSMILLDRERMYTKFAELRAVCIHASGAVRTAAGQ